MIFMMAAKLSKTKEELDEEKEVDPEEEESIIDQLRREKRQCDGDISDVIAAYNKAHGR